jgi:hypothetical protein
MAVGGRWTAGPARWPVSPAPTMSVAPAWRTAATSAVGPTTPVAGRAKTKPVPSVKSVAGGRVRKTPVRMATAVAQAGPAPAVRAGTVCPPPPPLLTARDCAKLTRDSPPRSRSVASRPPARAAKRVRAAACARGPDRKVLDSTASEVETSDSVLQAHAPAVSSVAAASVKHSVRASAARPAPCPAAAGPRGGESGWRLLGPAGGGRRGRGLAAHPCGRARTQTPSGSLRATGSGRSAAHGPALPRAVRSRQSRASSRAVSAVLMRRSSCPRLGDTLQRSSLSGPGRTS